MSDEETPTTPETPEATAAPEPTVEAPAAETPAGEVPVGAAPVAEPPAAEATVPDATTAVEAPTVADPPPPAPPVAAETEVAPGEPVAPVAPQPQPAPVAAMAAAPPAEPKRRGVFVPAWVAAVIALLVVAAIGFGVGRWTSDDSSDVSAPIANNGGIVPQLPGGNGNGNNNGNNGNGNNNGNGGQNTPATSTAFLGVATENADGGVAIVSVGDNTPADGAGLEEGDVITAVDNTDVSTPAELVQAIQSHDPGDSVTIHYTRDGDDESVRVTLGTRSQVNPN